MVASGLLGAGTPIIGPEAAAHLRPLDAERRDGSSNMVLRYAPIVEESCAR
jgi:hypothetical protein